MDSVETPKTVALNMKMKTKKNTPKIKHQIGISTMNHNKDKQHLY